MHSGSRTSASYPIRIAYVVPTKDRPDDLRVLLESVHRQTIKPDQLIIVDGSKSPVRGICDNYPSLNLTYVRVFPPSLAKQRNSGMAALNADITHAGYLDDDLELDENATAEIVKFWQHTDAATGGVAMNIMNQPRPRHTLIQKLFLMTGSEPGAVTPSGFQCPIPTLTRTIETRWLYGGATIWKRSVVESFAYDEWFSGHGLGEDYEFSYRVGRSYKLFVCADAKTMHYSGEMDLEKMYSLGQQQVFNRFYMHRKMGDFNSALFAWSIFGLIFMTFISSLRLGNSPARSRLMGNLKGLLYGIMGKTTPVLAYWKK